MRKEGGAQLRERDVFMRIACPAFLLTSLAVLASGGGVVDAVCWNIVALVVSGIVTSGYWSWRHGMQMGNEKLIR